MIKRHLVLSLLLLLCLVLMLGGDESRLAKARLLSRSLYYPFLNSLQTIRSIRQARIHNRTLHEQNALLLLRVIDLENRVETLAGSDIPFLPTVQHLIVADVIGFSGSFEQRQLIINRGTQDGLMVNDAVLNNQGAVGKVVAVAPHHATVLPFSHPQFRLGVADARTHVQGILENIGGHQYITMIPIDAQVALGDTVITSNLSTVFPKGVPVGVILKLERHPLHPYRQALLQPFANIGSIEQVIVLLSRKGDSDSLESAGY
ncbi:MAG: rod shape-determining protein MreC [Candidatus Cloacimonetes bacterium]|nr:rod shape-determining protein MreC [Candidatus Cloacimonadota bacterium]